MANPGGFSYKPNVNRAVTKKWKEASQPSYGGDDWDDDDDDYGHEQPAPVSAGNARHPAWTAQGQAQVYPSNRSVTNPSPSRSGGRPSFDRGDEKRYFSIGDTGFESAYPTTQRNPFSEPQHDYGPQPQHLRHPAPLHVNTQAQAPYPAPTFRPSSRGQQQRPNQDAPFSAPGTYPHSRSASGNRPVHGEVYPRRESPVRPDSRSSDTSAKHLPPRKSSLSQQQPPADLAMMPPRTSEPAQTTEPTTVEVKAAPAFVRPADIYKRLEAEREKERRSQDSARPSLDLNPSKTRDSSSSARSAASDTREPVLATPEDVDGQRRLKPTLDTVMERKSEYGFDNMLKDAAPYHPSTQPQSTTSEGVHRQITNASSVYTDRPDPVSASTVSRNVSLHGLPQQDEPASFGTQNYHLPSIDRMSTPGTDLSSIPPAASRHEQPALREPPPPVPAKDDQNKRLDSASLAHQPSLGYRSVVHQAFDESQNLNPRSPTSGSNTIPRSNSASTSEISPIMSRRTEQSSIITGPSITEQTIPEEPINADGRPASTSTVKGTSVEPESQPLPYPPTIQMGYRRDVTALNRDNSPAQRPLSIETGNPIKSHQGFIEPPGSQSATADILDAVEEDDRGRPGQLHAASATEHLPSLASSPLNTRTTSGEYQEWQSQRKQFNSKFGVQDSNPTTPGPPSPISRTESPPKGTVRDIAGKLESQSGRSTPVSVTLDSRPTTQPRMESFRPSIPGGWQSFTGTSASGTPAHEDTDPLKPPMLSAQDRFGSSDSIPTAKAPRNWEQERSGPASRAFAAAAAAGTALAGAFSGPALTQDTPGESQESSDDEWDRSPVSTKPDFHVSETRDFATAPADDHLVSQSLPEDYKPPTPLPKDTPRGENPLGLQSAQADHEALMGAETSSPADDYFPAPLRMSKSVDPKTVTRPPIPEVSVIDESASPRDNEQLQQEIVQSLTPKSSNFQSTSDHAGSLQDNDKSLAENQGADHHAISRNEDNLDGSQPTSSYPTFTVDPPPHGGSVHNPQQSISSASTASPSRPLFQHSFSWETSDLALTGAGSVTPPPVRSPSTQSPDTMRAPTETSTQHSLGTTRQVSNTVSSPIAMLTSPANEAPTPLTKHEFAGPPSLPHGAPPLEGASFRKIMNLESHQQRMNAYSRNRDVCAQSDGMLDQWIMSMRTPEHADVFNSGGRVNPHAASGPSTPNRPSPSRPMTNVGGGKIMPEDGKRLMAAAGRFGGKAGGAAKGLFAKGKEKLRQASAGDKGLLSNRRKSTGPSLLEPDKSQAPRPSSTLLTAPPQIPAQDLTSSPINAGEWSLPLRKGRDNQVSRPTERGIVHDQVHTSAIPSEPTREDHMSPGNTDAAIQPAFSVFGPQPVGAPREMIRDRNPSLPEESPSLLAPMSQPTVKPTRNPILGEHDSGRLEQGAQNESTAGDGYGQVPSYMPPSQRAPYSLSSPESSLANETALAEIEKSNTVLEDVVPAEQGLPVPNEARLSVVSNVSSASPSPLSDHEGNNIRRSVSPADNRPGDEATIPAYDTAVSSKAGEAQRDRSQNADEIVNDPVPAYDDNTARAREPRQPRIRPGAQIVPVADLSHHRRSELNTTSARPFSFDGSEVLSQAPQGTGVAETNEQLHNVPSQPLSPVSQTLSKSLSQVSVEEISEDPSGMGYRHSRSYSRPFGADPMRDHPALRQPVDTVDRAQMYSTESPLPSARRPQVGFERPRQQNPPVVKTEEEEGYRIPGPYRQEYRSPRQTSSPQPGPPAEPVRHASPAQYQHAQAIPSQYPPMAEDKPAAVTNQSFGPPPAPQPDRAKKGVFGGLFRNRSQSRSSRGQQAGPEADHRGVLRRNSRHNSVTSQQSSLHESRDVVGQLPPSQNPRRLSKNLRGSNTPTMTEPASDGKKKRFSLFSRGSKTRKSTAPQRASTLPFNSTQPGKSVSHPPDEHQVRNDALDTNGRQFQGSIPPVGGYYAQQEASHQQWNPPPQDSAHLQGQQQFHQRPADLRIDTTRGGRNTQTMPTSAPPWTHANRDISYQARSYVPPTARTSSAEPGSIPRGPSPHVAELHKRSRSPRLGRRSSEEERIANSGAGSTTIPGKTLGTFTNKKISPVGGIPRPDEDQEAPYRIGIPGESEEGRRRTRQLMIEQRSVLDSTTSSRAGTNSPTFATGGSSGTGGKTVAERMVGPQVPGQNTGGVASAVRAPMPRSVSTGEEFVAELPGSKAEGYESEEDVQMSATAYPGQWQDPIYFSDGRWED